MNQHNAPNSCRSLYPMTLPGNHELRNDPRTYAQEVTPLYGFNPNSRGLDNYFIDNEMYNYMQQNNSRVLNQLVPSEPKGLQQRQDMEERLRSGHEARNFPNNLLESRRDGRGLTVVDPNSNEILNQQILADDRGVETFYNQKDSIDARNWKNNEGCNPQCGIRCLQGCTYVQKDERATSFNPFVTEDEKIRVMERRKREDRRERLIDLGYDIDNPNDIGDGMERTNRHEEEVHDNMDLWIDKSTAENEQRYLKFNTREMPVSRVPQYPNSLISPDCNGIPLTRNEPNLNLTNQGSLPPHALDRYQCQNVRLENGNTSFVCKKVGECNTGYSYAGMSIDKDMTEKMQTHVPTRRVERSKLGMPNEVRNVVGTLGKTFKDPEIAEKVFFSRMSDCGNPLPYFDKNGDYVSANRAEGQNWNDCTNEVYPDTSNMAAYDSKELFHRTPYGEEGTGADLTFGLRTQYARGGLSKESELIRAAEAMNNTGSIMHGNNLYLPIEGELKDTIVNMR